MKGRDALSVGAVERAAGSASTANALIDGSALLSEASAGCASRRTSRSAGTEEDRAASCTAKASVVVLKFVISPWSAPSSAFSAAKVRCWPRRTRWMRRGSWPSVASLASAVFLYAGSQ